MDGLRVTVKSAEVVSYFDGKETGPAYKLVVRTENTTSKDLPGVVTALVCDRTISNQRVTKPETISPANAAVEQELHLKIPPVCVSGVIHVRFQDTTIGEGAFVDFKPPPTD